jgi:YndJ-like protein
MNAFFPVLIWLAWVMLLGPVFRQNQWECLLIMFAAIELVPKGLRMLGLPQKEWYALLAAGLCAAYFFTGYWFLALPYLLWAAWLTIREAGDIILLKRRQLLDFVRVFALGYWTIGALFAVFYLADFSPLSFDPVIVSLTGSHFHVAGFALAVLVYKLIQLRPTGITRFLGWATLAGMPLVAAGITLTKLGFSAVLEQVSALGFGLFVLILIWQQIALSFRSEDSKATRLLWFSGAICLLFGVTLDGLYALRFQIPMQWVSIPNMKIWHGTVNTLGFAWLSLLGWELMRNHS